MVERIHGKDEVVGSIPTDGSRMQTAFYIDVPYFKQDTDYTCGPASLQMVLAYFGIRESEEALADYEQILREATKEVEEILATIKASKSRQESLKKSVTSSQRSFNQAETLYQEGLISFLDVVDAQRVFADARQNLASEQTNYSVNVSRLFEALGVDIKHDKTQEENNHSNF